MSFELQDDCQHQLHLLGEFVLPKREVATKMRDVADFRAALRLWLPPLLVWSDWPENLRLLGIVMNCTNDSSYKTDHRNFRRLQQTGFRIDQHHRQNDFLPVLSLSLIHI